VRHLIFAATLILTMVVPAIAQESRPLTIQQKRTLTFPRPIGRIEVDRDNVVAVAAPTPRSLRVTGIGAGEATVSVFGRDGNLMAESLLTVSGTANLRDARTVVGPRVIAGEQVVAVDVQFAAVSASTLKALGFNFSKLSGDIQGAVVSPNQIVLKIAPEVSELDYGSGVQLQGYVVPGLRRRSAETTVELGSGQSFVIAGLSYSSQSSTRDKTPLLGDIPVIGAFFRRQQVQKERQELVIVATPRLVGPMQPKDVPALPGSLFDMKDPVVPFGVVRP